MLFLSLLSLCSISFARQLSSAQPAGGKYIVLLNPGSTGNGASAAAGLGVADTTSTYDFPGQPGFAAKLTREQAQQILSHPDVALVEPNAVLHTHASTTQSDPPNWGLGRISHRNKTSTQYIYDGTAGQGTCGYIVDSGVSGNAEEFGSRLVIKETFDRWDGTPADLFGHGTHVAGIFASRSYGVAKNAKIFSVKVVNATGEAEAETFLQAMDYIIQDSRMEAKNCPKGFVVNLSLGIDTSPLNPASVQIGESLQTGVTHLINEGLFAAISAGNGNRDAKDTSPANTPRACTVGNLDIDNKIWRGFNEWNDGASNYGATVKIWAPGAHIISTYPFQKPSPGMQDAPDLAVYSNYSASMSGTSMAAPHVAGLAAYVLGLENRKYDPVSLCSRLVDLSTNGTITNMNDPQFADFAGPNLVAYNGNGA